METGFDPTDSPGYNDEDSDMMSESSCSDQIRSTFLFMVGPDWSHAYLRQANDERLSIEAAKHLEIPLSQLVALYPVRFQPLGVPATSYAFLVHRTYDVAVAHMREMVLCDVVTHTRASGGLQQQPSIRRIGKWLPQTLTRSQLIFELGLQDRSLLQTIDAWFCTMHVWFPHNFQPQ